jgi:predicted  nucleic acid-binding Zn-ribbon protein
MPPKKDKPTPQCVDCGKAYKRTGNRQIRCEPCAVENKLRVQRDRRGGKAAPGTRTGGGAKPDRAKQERQPVAERSTSALARGFRVRIGKLEVECDSLDALAELVERFGGDDAG